MKTPLKMLLTLIVVVTFFNCSNDDDINNPAVNVSACTYAGFTFLDTGNNTQTLIPESDLTTDFFPNSLGLGMPQIEIFQTSGPSNMVFVTDVVTLNATGTGILQINTDVYTVNVVCQRAGTAVGDEFRFDVTAAGLEVEFCVVTDGVFL